MMIQNCIDGITASNRKCSTIAACGCVAHRLLAAALAGAEPDLLGFVGFEFDRAERGGLVRAVAERLRFGAPAGAPPIALAALDVDRQRPPAADFRHLAHVAFPAPLMLLPPPSVASHAAPQALASSRTRRM